MISLYFCRPLETFSCSPINHSKMAASRPKLYTNRFCPFNQRAWMALLHKGVDFEYVEQNPYDKSPEWLAISPKGLAPVIVHNGHSIYESAVCIEYADEAFTTDIALLPKDPYLRAVQRIWSDHIAKKVVPNFFGMLIKKTEEEREKTKQDLLEALSYLFQHASPTGPFFGGDQVQMVDLMLAPYALIFYMLRHYRDFDVSKMANYDRFKTWVDAVGEVDGVKKTQQPRDQVLQYFQKYNDGTAKSQVAKSILAGTQLP